MRNLMKFLKKQFALVAFIFAIGAAFAFTETNHAEVEDDFAVIWFELDASGNVLGTMDPDYTCGDGEDYCAVKINEEDLTSQGQPQFTNVQQASPEHYEEIVLRD